jgi:hypothetical protein
VAPSAPDTAPAATSSSWLDSPKNLGLGLGVVGAFSVGVGSVFGILSASTWSKVNGACGAGGPGQCVTKDPTSVTSDHNTAQTEAAVSTVAFIAGGVLIAAGVAVFLGAAHPGSGEPAVALTPTVGPGQGGLALRGAF